MNSTLTDLVAALGFTELPEASDAEREEYLREWARRHYDTRGMRERASVAGHAAAVFKYRRLGHADLAAQSIPSVLRRLDAIVAFESSLAAWRTEEPEVAAMIDEWLAQAERIDAAVVALAQAPLETVLEQARLIADMEERGALYRGLAERASGERRTGLVEAAAETARMQEGPQARCHATLALLPLLEGPSMALALDIALTGALNDLDEIPPHAWPSYVERLAPHLAANAAEALVERAGHLADTGREGAAKAACFAILAPRVSSGNREQTRYLAQFALQALEPDDRAYARLYIRD
jgi:hypothetical protein